MHPSRSCRQTGFDGRALANECAIDAELRGNMPSDLQIREIARAGELENTARTILHQHDNRVAHHGGFDRRHSHVAEGTDRLASRKFYIPLAKERHIPRYN